jgi:hypothetical protein
MAWQIAFLLKIWPKGIRSWQEVDYCPAFDRHVRRRFAVVPVLAARKRPTSPALAVRDRAWEVCSVISKLVSRHDDGNGFGWPGAPAAMGIDVPPTLLGRADEPFAC